MILLDWITKSWSYENFPLNSLSNTYLKDGMTKYTVENENSEDGWSPVKTCVLHGTFSMWQLKNHATIHQTKPCSCFIKFEKFEFSMMQRILQNFMFQRCQREKKSLRYNDSTILWFYVVPYNIHFFLLLFRPSRWRYMKTFPFLKK